MEKIYNIKLINIQNNPQYYLFYTYWLIINNNTNEIIGRIGFKDIPNQMGEIEIGYGTHTNYRSKGFMTEALKAITINPAEILKVDDRVGSIEKGKDADLVIFNGNPLDISTDIIKVIINGEVVETKKDGNT